MPLLVLAVLRVAWSANKELEGDRVVHRVQVALAVEQVNPVESIVAPALADFELGGELSDDLCAGRPMIDHLDPVLVLLRLLLRQSLQHLQEHANVVAFRDAVSVWIHLQSPSQARLRDQRWVRVDYLVVVLDLVALALPYSRKVLNHEDGLLVLGHDVGRKVNAHFVVDELVRLFCVDLLELSNQIPGFLYQGSLWHLG